MSYWTRNTPLAAIRPEVDREDLVENAELAGGRPVSEGMFWFCLWGLTFRCRLMIMRLRASLLCFARRTVRGVQGVSSVRMEASSSATR